MNREQLNHLKERLAQLRREKRAATDQAEQPPAAVQDARKIVKRWEAQELKKSNRRYERLQRAYNVAHEAIMFREAGDALKAVQDFERFKP